MFSRAALEGLVSPFPGKSEGMGTQIPKAAWQGLVAGTRGRAGRDVPTQRRLHFRDRPSPPAVLQSPAELKKQGIISSMFFSGDLAEAELFPGTGLPFPHQISSQA